jgi:hypothetical protein
MNEFEEFAKRARRTDLGGLDAVVIAIGCALVAADVGLGFHGVAILAGVLFVAHGWAALKRGDVVDVARDNPYYRQLQDQQVEAERRDFEPLARLGWSARDPRRLMLWGCLLVLFGIGSLLAR